MTSQPGLAGFPTGRDAHRIHGLLARVPEWETSTQHVFIASKPLLWHVVAQKVGGRAVEQSVSGR